MSYRLATVLDWIRRHTHQWQWLAVMGAFAVVSGFTNTDGLSHILPIAAAIAMGVGLQAVATWAGLRLSKADDESRGPWLTLYLPVVAASVFFSFQSLSSKWASYKAASRAPALERKDLLTDAKLLAGAIDQGRQLVLPKLRSEQIYQSGRVERAREKLAKDLYANPEEGHNHVAERTALLDDVKAQRQKWLELGVDVHEIVRGDVKEGYAKLRKTHDAFSTLAYDVPAKYDLAINVPPTPEPPTEDLDEAAAGKFEFFGDLLARLLSLSGLIFLAFAIGMEVVPLLGARALSAEVGAEELVDGGTYEPPSWASHVFSVKPQGPFDESTCWRMSRFIARGKAAALGGILDQTLDDMRESHQSFDDALSLYREGELGKLRNEALKLWLEANDEQHQLLRRFAQRIGDDGLVDSLKKQALDAIDQVSRNQTEERINAA